MKSGIVASGGWAWQQAEAELLDWKNHPIKRAGELKRMAARICEDWVFSPMSELRHELSTWHGFKNASWQAWKSVHGTATKSWTITRNLWKDMVGGLTDWGDDFCDRMMTGAEKAHWDAVPWNTTKLEDDINEVMRQASYTFGYTFGYISEQIAVGTLSAGSVKVAQVATKGGVRLAANLARRTAANVAAYQRGFAVASTGPGMDKCAMHMMQETAVQRMKTAIDDLVTHSPGAPTPLRLHTLKKSGTSSDQLQAALVAYRNELPTPDRDRIEIIIDSFELSQ